MTRFTVVGKFFLLVLLLNIIRYTLPVWLEQWLVFPGLMEEMENNQAYFNTGFTTVDW